jgi:hypothetical protein
MSYNLTATGDKGHVVGSIRNQAGQARAGLPTEGERSTLDAEVKALEELLEKNMREGDTASVTLTGYESNAPTAFAMQKQCGITIMRAGSVISPSAISPAASGMTAGAPGTQPAPTTAAPATGEVATGIPTTATTGTVPAAVPPKPQV